jgi:hypothetical protein
MGNKDEGEETETRNRTTQATTFSVEALQPSKAGTHGCLWLWLGGVVVAILFDLDLARI